MPEEIEMIDAEEKSYSLDDFVENSLFKKNRSIYFVGLVEEFSCINLIQKLHWLDNQSHDPIKLYINSGGGSISDGLPVIDTFKKIKSPVETIGLGLCASMAAVLLIAGQKGKRSLSRSSTIMFHRASYMATQDYDEQQKTKIKFLEKESRRVYKEIAKIMKKPLRIIEKEINAGLWLDSGQALKRGIIDSIY